MKIKQAARLEMKQRLAISLFALGRQFSLRRRHTFFVLLGRVHSRFSRALQFKGKQRAARKWHSKFRKQNNNSKTRRLMTAIGAPKWTRSNRDDLQPTAAKRKKVVGLLLLRVSYCAQRAPLFRIVAWFHIFKINTHKKRKRLLCGVRQLFFLIAEGAAPNSAC